METIIGFPSLGNDLESLAIIKSLEVDFFSFLLSRQDSLNNFLELQRKGNTKAHEIILWLFENKRLGSNSDTKRELFFKDTTNKITILGLFDFKWNNFVIKDMKTEKLVEFDCEILMHERSEIQVIESFLKMTTYNPELRKGFLEERLIPWLNSLNYKLWTFGPKKNYRRKVFIEYLDVKEAKTSDIYGATATHAKAQCKFKIISL